MDNATKAMRISKAICAVNGAYWKISKLSGLKENLFWLLYVLNDGKFHTQKQICEDWLFPKTTVNTLIKECEGAGYVILQTIPGQKRELEICLTPKGKAYADKILRPVYEIEKNTLSVAADKCSPSFAADLELFAGCLQSQVENYAKQK